MRVLVYGDSNSWGYLDDGLVLRFADRWPVEMARALAAQGRPVELVEECLPGRTTNLTDPKMGDFVDGAAPFEAILRSHIPLDLILIMLGTNDVKAHFGRSTDEIIGGLMALSDIVSASEVWPGPDPVGARLGFIAPPVLGPKADDPGWDIEAGWVGSRAKTEVLPDKIEAACRLRGHLFFDGNHGATSSDRDPIHWNEATHVRMGAAVAEWVLKAL
ncbi:MAG: arylesterase [Geminicoccus sp.]|nr:arylesterase [Geminicoccus sp.]